MRLSEKAVINKLPTSRAISRAFSLIVVFAIVIAVLAALLGAVSYLYLNVSTHASTTNSTSFVSSVQTATPTITEVFPITTTVDVPTTLFSTLTTASTQTLPVTQTTTLTKTSSVTSVSTSYWMVEIPAPLPQCSAAEQQNQSSTFSGANGQPYSFKMNQNSDIYICVRLFFYNSTTASINPISVISLSEMTNNGEYRNNAMSNFTVSASPANITIGGPSNANEGAEAIYTIHSNSNSNGTYVLNFGWAFSPRIADCTTSYLLVVGNGIPNYSYYGSCITMTTTGGNTPLPTGIIFTEVVASGTS